MNQPPYNPQAQRSPYPQQSSIGFEQYPQGAPPPYSGPPGQYPPQYPPGQGPYGPPGQGPYGPPPGPYGTSGPGPYGAAAHYPAGQNPQTVYVYEDRKRQQKSSEEDTCLAMMAGACAMCLCCSLLSD